MRILKSINSFTKDTITTSILGVAGKSISFLIPFFIAAWFGVSRETDAFFFAYEIIFYILGIFSPVLENVIVPYAAQLDKQRVGRFAGAVLSFSVVIMFSITAALLLFAKPLIGLITDFSANEISLIHKLLAETAILVFFVVASSTIAGLLNTFKKFSLPAISPAFRAAITLIIIFLTKERFGVHSLAIGYVVGDVIRLTVLYLYLKHTKLCRIQINFSFNKQIADFFKVAGFQIAALSITGLYPFIDKVLASWLTEGNISILHYAYRLYLIPITFFMTGLMVTILSYWSGKYLNDGYPALRRDLIKVSIFVVPAAAIISFGLYIFSDPIISLVYGRNGFSTEILSEVGWVMKFFLLGFILDVMYNMLVRANICVKNTPAILTSSILMVILSVILKIILMKLIGVRGIALGFSLSLLIPVVYLAVSLERFGTKKINI